MLMGCVLECNISLTCNNLLSTKSAEKDTSLAGVIFCYRTKKYLKMKFENVRKLKILQYRESSGSLMWLLFLEGRCEVRGKREGNVNSNIKYKLLYFKDERRGHEPRRWVLSWNKRQFFPQERIVSRRTSLHHNFSPVKLISGFWALKLSMGTLPKWPSSLFQGMPNWEPPRLLCSQDLSMALMCRVCGISLNVLLGGLR